jgi:citrate lyase subunit beta/citryl-CoA lyase
LIRSFLFVPGDSPRKLEKAPSTSADALIVDLEDAVEPAKKDEARQLTRAFLDKPRGHRKVFVRINAYDTGMVLRDLQSVMPGRPDGIMLPKCSGASDIAVLGNQLDGFEACLRWEVGSTLIIPVATETPAAVLNLPSYLSCGPRLWGMLWGGEDLAGAIGATANRHEGRYRSPFLLARDQCLLAAAAANIVAIDAVYIDVRDNDGLRQETQEARIDGFGAKAAIYPAHCDIINDVFRPTEAEVVWAKSVIDALQQSAGGGVAVLDGKMIDKPHIVQARRILDRCAGDRSSL